MSLHSFDPHIAAQVGVNAAVIYQNLVFWAEKNKANQKHIKGGYVWTYNSRRAFSELFPYLSESQVKTAINKLVDSGLVIKGEYNKSNYDRTNWYSPAVTADWVNSAIGQKTPMDRREITNELDIFDQPIPDSKPYNKPDDILGTLCRWASEDAVKSFIAYRRKSKSKALTLTAAKRLASQLEAIFNQGGDTNDALGLAEEHGWQTIKSEWYFNSKNQTNSQQRGNAQFDEARERALRIGGATKAQGDIGF